MPPKQGRIYVIYHGQCMDGFGAAYAAWTKLGDTAKYVAVSHHDHLPPMRDNSEVYILDMSYPREVLLELNSRMKKVVVLDHHKTSQAALEGLDFCHFDMNKSGAMLAWEYFRPTCSPPDLIMYIQDRDLWKWELVHSKEVSEVIYSWERDFQWWQDLEHKIEYSFIEAVKEGEAIMRFRAQQVKQTVLSAYLTDINGHKVPVVNANQNISEICHTLLDEFPDSPFSAAFFELEKGTWVVSLRSRGDFDVSEVAKANDGGGHKAAAGYHIQKENIFDE